MGYKVPVLPYRPKRHSNRRRPFQMMDGSKPKVLQTRYTYEWGTRISEEKGPLGGKRYERFPRWVYYYEGRFYKNANAPMEGGGFANVLVPINGLIWDAHEEQSKLEGIPVVSIWCDGGEPYRADHEEFGTVWQKADGIGELEDWLYLDGRRLPRKRTA